MKKDTSDLKLLFFFVASFAVAYLLLPARISLPFNDFPNQYHYFAFKRTAPIPAKIVAVAIDDYSLNAMAGRWPWQRSVYADLLRNLDAEGARTIAMDLVLKGSSDDAQDTSVLTGALQGLSASVVLGYDFDFRQMAPGAISDELVKTSYAAGMLNTLLDEDGFIRKMRVLCKVKDRTYYSFSVMAVAAFLGQDPERVVSGIRTIADRRFQGYHNFEDRYFYIDYKVKQYQKDNAIPVISFYDVLTDMAKLKAAWGNDFLKDSLVLVYPAAEIRHDIHLTPLGKMPGGFVHLNAMIDILSGSSVDTPAYIPLVMFLASAIVLWFAMRSNNFQLSLAMFAVVLVFNFLSALFLWRAHVKTDFFRVAAFCGIFFVVAGVYKVIEFLSRLAAIKDRATLDPLRGIHTARYFRYRLELEARRRRVYVVMIYLISFKNSTDDISLDRLKEIWTRIRSALARMHTCWAGYSAEEVAGYSLIDAARLEGVLEALRSNLETICAELDMKVPVKVCAAEFKKDWSCPDVLSALSRQVRSSTANVLVMADIPLMKAEEEEQDASARAQTLDGLAEDIDEKNRQLLSMYEKLKAEHGKTKEVFYQIIMSLVNALEARDPYTQGHSQRVADYALLVADKLGWQQDQKERLRKASLLHDLGKIGIPDSILHKKGQLSDEEFGIIKQHEIFGVNILKPLKDVEDILPWILYHHEKWDGTGYPHGLGGDAIPLASQIIALADVYDALTTGRDYKKSLSQSDAIAIILKGKGTHFKPELADLFVSVIK